MRDYARIDGYLNELRMDVYPQPQDSGHTAWAKEVFDKWTSMIRQERSVLDVGCGEAFMQPWFHKLGMAYTGVCLGEDVRKSVAQGRNVREMDFHFLDFPDSSFDMIFSRHSLEHSPMPLLALMEWHRVASNSLCLILPNPEFFGRRGRNHYSVVYDDQARFLLKRSGWNVVLFEEVQHELHYFCKKHIRSATEYQAKLWD